MLQLADIFNTFQYDFTGKFVCFCLFIYFFARRIQQNNFMTYFMEISLHDDVIDFSKSLSYDFSSVRF